MNTPFPGSLGLTPSTTKNFLWGGAFFLLYILIYGLLLPRLGLHQDEVLDFDGSAIGTYIGAGRWGLGLYRNLFGGGAVPWAAGIMAGLYLSTAIVLQAQLLRLDTPGLKLCYGALMLGMPQFASMLVYSHQADAIALGYVLCTLANLLLFRKGTLPPSRWLLAILLMSIAIGIYQVLLFYGCALAIGSLLAQRDEKESPFPYRLAYRFGLTFLLAFILYYILRAATLALPLTSEEQLEYSLQYQQRLTQWGTFLSLTLTQKLLFLAHYLKCRVYSELGLMYAGQWVYTTALIPLVLLTLRHLKQKEAWSTRLYSLTAPALLWVIPHIMIILLGTYQGERLNLPEPLCCALLWIIWLKSASLTPTLKRIGSILLIFILIQSCYTVSRIAWQEELNHGRNIHDMRLLCADARRFAAEKGITTPELRICPVSVKRPPPPHAQRKAYGPLRHLISCFSEQEMVPARPNPLCDGVAGWYDRLYHFSADGNHLVPLPSAEREQWKGEIRKLTTWPTPGCMILKGNSVIVRVSKEWFSSSPSPLN